MADLVPAIARLLALGGPCLWLILALGTATWSLALALAARLAWPLPHEDPRAGLWLLRAGAAGAPLIGLLGTVIGIGACFADLGATGGTRLASGIAEALVSTAAGLSVAVPAAVAHALLARRAEVLAAQGGGR